MSDGSAAEGSRKRPMLCSWSDELERLSSLLRDHGETFSLLPGMRDLGKNVGVKVRCPEVSD